MSVRGAAVPPRTHGRLRVGACRTARTRAHTRAHARAHAHTRVLRACIVSVTSAQRFSSVSCAARRSTSVSSRPSG
eukprot:4026201-Prymnesium_polylepis.1